MSTTTLNKLIEARREAISKKAKTVEADLKKGESKAGNLKDLYRIWKSD